MPSSAALIARDQRILAGYRAGATAKRIAADLDLLVKQVNRLVEERTLSCGSGVARSRSEARTAAHARLSAAVNRGEFTPQLRDALRGPVVRAAHIAEIAGVVIVVYLMVVKPF